MPLVLSTVRCPPGVSPQNREVVRGVISIGRTGECDWVLPDPERILSKRHCLLSWHDNAWLVTDTSSNGTLLNGEALDPGVPRQLRGGDRLALGAYEIEVRLDEGGWEAAEPATITARRIRPDAPPWPPGGEAPARADDTLIATLDRTGPPAGPAPATNDPAPQPASPQELAGTGQPRPPGTAAGGGTAVDASQAVGGTAGAAEGFRAFAEDAGVAGSPGLDPGTALGQLGAAFRAMVAGMRRMAAAPPPIRDGSGAGRTAIHGSANPLHRAADDDEAVSLLLGIGQQDAMAPDRAVADALEDLRRHERAAASALRQAVRELLASLDPAGLLRALPASAGDAFPGRRKARLWDAYEARHGRLARALAEDFDGVLAAAYARAYEAALAEPAASGADRGAPGPPTPPETPPPGTSPPGTSPPGASP